MGNMAGVFLILAGALVAIIGLRGTHAAVFGNLFQNTATADSTAQAASNAVNKGSKPANNKGVFV